MDVFRHTPWFLVGGEGGLARNVQHMDVFRHTPLATTLVSPMPSMRRQIRHEGKVALLDA